MTSSPLPTPTIPAEVAAELFEYDDDQEYEGWIRVGVQHIRTSRWEERYWLVVADTDGAQWGVEYGEGLTEYQETIYPWDEDWRMASDLPLVRLYPHEVTKTEWRKTPAETAPEVVPGRREAAILRWAAARIRDECRHPENDGGLWCAARAQDLDLWAAGIEDTARIEEEN